jgi:hypothetical protein
MTNPEQVVDLLGDTPLQILMQTRTNLYDYDAFVEKFKEAKTTDDCYTPPEVYDTVLEWLFTQVEFDKEKVLRPFYKDKPDYRRQEYPADSCVIDNPPFSISSQIVHFYETHKIPYFLFANALTLFATWHGEATNYLPIGTSICYANNAKISTSFISNMLGDDNKVIFSKDLRDRLEAFNPVKHLIKTKYPPNYHSSASCVKYSRRINAVVKKAHFKYSRGFEGKANVFGAGFFLLDEEKNNELKEVLND